MITNKILLNNIIDLRMKKQSSMVEYIDINIIDRDKFIKNMNDIGYQLLGDNFLVKNENGKEFNLTLKDDKISTLTIYENNESVDITEIELFNIINEINENNN